MMWVKHKVLADSYMALVYKQFLPEAKESNDKVSIKYYEGKVKEYEAAWGPYKEEVK